MGISKKAAIIATAIIALSLQMASGESRNLANGFMDHGVAAPVSVHRGTVTTIDGGSNPTALSWLMAQKTSQTSS